MPRNSWETRVIHHLMWLHTVHSLNIKTECRESNVAVQLILLIIPPNVWDSVWAQSNHDFHHWLFTSILLNLLLAALWFSRYLICIQKHTVPIWLTSTQLSTLFRSFTNPKKQNLAAEPTPWPPEEEALFQSSLSSYRQERRTEYSVIALWWITRDWFPLM